MDSVVVAAVSDLMDPGRQVARKLVRLISDDDIEQMGVRTYTLIIKGIEAIQAARASIAINPPPIQHCPECDEEQNCNRAWQNFWFSTIPRIVMAPDHPRSLQSIITLLGDVNIKNFRAKCKTLTLSDFEQTEIVKVETTMKHRAASAIWDLYKQDLK